MGKMKKNWEDVQVFHLRPDISLSLFSKCLKGRFLLILSRVKRDTLTQHFNLGGSPLREGDGGPTLFRSHFLKLLSYLGRVFEIIVPFSNFCPF